jgi:hypothetical protein
MHIQAERAIEIDSSQCESKQGEAMWFLVWMGVWLVALAALLPAVI